MGLDNGFKVRHLTNMDLPVFVRLPWDKADEEIAYWRKCWGLRREINQVLHLPSDMYEIQIERDDLPAVLKVIKKYLNPQYWEENAESIWDWEQYFEHNLQQYINLNYLYEIWALNPDLEVIWYDSY